jgi:hypothetical protein
VMEIEDGAKVVMMFSLQKMVSRAGGTRAVRF